MPQKPQTAQPSTKPTVDFFDQFRQPVVPPPTSGGPQDFFAQFRTQPVVEPTSNLSRGSTMMGNILGPSLSQFNPLNILEGLKQTVIHPYDTARMVLSPLKRWGNIPNQLAQGEYTEAANSFAGGLPIVGPMGETASQRSKAGASWDQTLGDVLAMTTALAGGELVAPAAGAIAGVIGKTPIGKVPAGLAEIGLKRTPTMRQEFPNAGATLVKEAVLTPRAASNRLRQVEEGLKTHVAKAKGVYDSDLVDDAAYNYAFDKGMVGTLDSNTAAQRTTLSDLSDKFRDANLGQPLNADELLKLKRKAGNEANWFSTKQDSPTRMNEYYNQGTSIGAREGLQHIFRSEGIGDAVAILDRERELIGLGDALERAYTPSSLNRGVEAAMLATSAVNKNPLKGLGTVALMEALRSPRLWGGAAIGLDRLAGLPSNPNAIQAAIIASLIGQGKY